MTELVQLLESYLIDSAPDHNRVLQRALRLHGELSGLDAVRGRGVVRLIRAWPGLATNETRAADIAVLLRQVIRTYGMRLHIPAATWRLLQRLHDRAGLWVTGGGSDPIEIYAGDWAPDWLPGSATIDRLELRRPFEVAIGDGVLYAMMGVSAYQSMAQKVAVDACLFAPPGSTTLVTLPTGAGKSLCALLPAWSDTAGGRIPGGTTIVVVPTVSLALDQQEQAARLFPDAFDASSKPQAWTGATPPEIRAAILRGLRHGTLPILYTSPESLIHSVLYSTCLEAAAAGHLRRFVIDEAHIVETWGTGFRTEFQLLATYRRALLAASDDALRTLLLSATVTTTCDELLRALFADDGKFQRVRANRLRPEPAYWFTQADSEEVRHQRVLEALHYLPRPATLYVTQPETANTWHDSLRETGFKRVATYTGLTRDNDRRHLLRRWRDGEIDVMVANSAFGLGVDKGDVRTIIHACLPENIDRFYQEVGRGGRDGYVSISLCCTAPDDASLAWSMAASQVITTGIARSRWEGMWRRSTPVTGHGDLRLIDTNAPPIHDPGMQPSDLNQNWNAHTVLLLQRAGLLKITQTRDRAVDTAGSERLDDQLDLLQVQLLDPDTLADGDVFEHVLEPWRTRERQHIEHEIRRMEHLVHDYAGDQVSRCLANQLAPLYPDCAAACGGCSACRQQHRRPHVAPLEVFVDRELPTDRPSGHQLATRLAERLQAGPLNLYWSDPHWIANPKGLRQLIADAVSLGVQQLLIDDSLLNDMEWRDELVRHLAHHVRTPHMILPCQWVRKRVDVQLHRLSTIVVYPSDERLADQFHRSFRERCARELAAVPLITIVRHDLSLESEHGFFRDRIGGTPNDVHVFQNWLSGGELDQF